ncbi:hypothetical protein RB195_017196 [Necator americanus]|uniref:Uncharacterized protein n=1 Tax=Necator americanus TaxID=51031 RepID=A0ABR1C438_NECAM
MKASEAVTDVLLKATIKCRAPPRHRELQPLCSISQRQVLCYTPMVHQKKKKHNKIIWQTTEFGKTTRFAEFSHSYGAINSRAKFNDLFGVEVQVPESDILCVYSSEWLGTLLALLDAADFATVCNKRKKLQHGRAARRRRVAIAWCNLKATYQIYDVDISSRNDRTDTALEFHYEATFYMLGPSYRPYALQCNVDRLPLLGIYPTLYNSDGREKIGSIRGKYWPPPDAHATQLYSHLFIMTGNRWREKVHKYPIHPAVPAKTDEQEAADDLQPPDQPQVMH